MYYFKKLRSIRRNNTRLFFVPQSGPRAMPGTGLSPGTGAPYTQPDTTTIPVGSNKNLVQTAVDRSYNKKSVEDRKTTSLPKEQPKGRNTMKKQNTKKNQKRKQDPDKPFVYVPRGGRPKDDEPLKFTSSDRVPNGTDPYRDGPATFTPSDPFGKIGELPNLNQSIEGWNRPASDLNNIRTLFQTVVPRFFTQFPSGKALDAGLNRNQENIFYTFFNQIGDLYQVKYNLNKQYFDTFTLEKVFVYFYGVHELHAELVCYLQRAAYYRNLDTGMENLLLDNLSTVLNTTDFYEIRNRMARALRTNYLPMSIINETYETFQTYRMGDLVTSSSTVYVTPAMAKLIDELGDASTPQQYYLAQGNYQATIDAMIENVFTGRPNNSTGTDGIKRHWRTTNGAGVSADVNIPIFDQGKGGITQNEIKFLNSVFGRVCNSTNLTLLNNIREGNSASHSDADFNDRFANQQTVAGTTRVFPYMVTSSPNAGVTPSKYESVAFASERKAEDVSYKAVMYQAEKFTGGGALFFATESSNKWSRFYIEQRPRRTDLLPEMDVGFTASNHYAQVTNQSRPFVQDNYVCKVFANESGTTNYYTQNVDSTAAAMWFVTFGDLMEQQFQHGIDILK